MHDTYAHRVPRQPNPQPTTVGKDKDICPRRENATGDKAPPEAPHLRPPTPPPQYVPGDLE